MPKPIQQREKIVRQTFTLAGLKFRLANRSEQLRLLSIAPPGAKLGPDVSGGQLWMRAPALVHVRGRERLGHFGARAILGQPGMALKLKSLKKTGGNLDGRIVAEMTDLQSNLTVTLTYQAVGAKHAIRVLLEARNDGDRPVIVEQLLVCLPGMGRPDNDQWGSTTQVHFAHNTWFGEAQWQQRYPSELGIADTRPPFGDTLGAAVWRNVGTWSTCNFLPMGVLEDRDSGISWFWQIEYSASWQMEVGRLGSSFYMAGGGPSERWGQCSVTLQPGETYHAAPVGFGAVEGGFEDAIAALQGYRRAGCRPASEPDRTLPLFFNDYMNTLKGNPTIENELPLIDAAAKAGAQYYVIDAGWFDPRDKTWGYGIGDWQESADRFGPAGLRGITDHIRSRGMVPGLWLEIEVVTDNSQVSKKPDSWFLCAHGHRVVAGGRMFFNFANPQVRQYCHDVVDRLCRDYGIGYIKFDYNADAGVGDNQNTASLGEGQLHHMRGVYQWLDELRQRHPDLILENCGSGGMRFDYGMLSRTHVQSTSDQEDYRRYPSIMAGVLAAGLPEQMCIWSYPQPEFDDEAICLNLVTPMLCRWHLAGRLDRMSERQLALVRAATDVWKSRIRRHIPRMTPFWPTPWRHLHEQDTWLAAGLHDAARRHAFISVFRLGAEQKATALPLDRLDLKGGAKAQVLFPTDLGGSARLDVRKKVLVVELPRRYSARLIEIRIPAPGLRVLP